MTTDREDNPVLYDFPHANANIFLMMRFRDTKQHRDIANAIASVIDDYPVYLIRADTKPYHQELWTNVRLCIEASSLGIAVFEQIDEDDINPNVSLELGYMLAQGKKCLLLKEKRIKTLNSDLLGHLYYEFDSYQIEDTVKSQVKRWLKDLGIAKKADERLLIYVSQGGTCRCAMAKAITRQLLKDTKPGFKLRVESAAYGLPSAEEASHSAQQAISSIYGDDLLAEHVPMKLSPSITEEADLILVMGHSLLKGLPQEKTHVLKPFFGFEGDIVDPWPDDKDIASKERYASCAAELKIILGDNINKIIEALRPN